MSGDIYLAYIINQFEKWWTQDVHSSNMDFYSETISFPHLSSYSEEDFISFFYEFVNEGGKVQSGGHRTKNIFLNSVLSDSENFRQFVFQPFQNNFSVKTWFRELKSYPGFGFGIATIFLNRIDYNEYPIMNNKTINALNNLGHVISSTQNWNNYQLVKKIQDELIQQFPILSNYYKVDALNHFLVGVDEGKDLIHNYNKIAAKENEAEQEKIELEFLNSRSEKSDLYNKIIHCERDEAEKIFIKGKAYKRHNYLMVQIKKYRQYKCQFCNTSIPKSNGGFYIEACHIKAKSKGGKDSLDNILVLCPNCHKLFDYNKRIEEKHTKESYSVILNGKKYSASLK